MSSEKKSSRRIRPGPRKKTAAKTSKRTSKSQRSLPGPQQLLFDLAKLLSRKKLRWYVFGAQALNLYGAIRLTADVDVTVEVGHQAIGPLFAAMKRAGFIARVQDPLGFAEKTRVVPFVHRATEMALDFVIAGDGLEMLFLDRARSIEVADFVVPVISPDDLIVAKLLAGRVKDFEDVRMLLRGSVELKNERIRATLAELDELLEHADLLPAFEALLADTRG